MKKYAIIVAGGSGRRMGTDVPKQFLLLAGRPVLMYAIEAFHRYDAEMKIILVLPAAQQDYWQKLCVEHKFSIAVTLVSGGNSRFLSVKNGLAEVKDSDALVAVHDGVRPLVTSEIIASVFEAAAGHDAAYPAVPVVDTLRKITLEGKVKDVEREQFRLVQTPQVFHAPVLREAYADAPDSPHYTDDVSVVTVKLECEPQIVAGSKENIKITTPEDLLLAEAILKCRK
ncbi:2-C-methyl-D-erythritol 4-phosphate cytidylyltransferase [Bacteroidia bacterium]|nr:2-C-methyl-D-erythritol 4-phosphate cytidylyltransferase [Bacteroidia bacterium]